MKYCLQITFVALATAWAAPSKATAAVVFSPGDLLIGFHATGGQGANDTYVFNLGLATDFRDATSSFTVTSQPGFSTLGADLTAIFGASWFSRTDLFWGSSANYSNAPFGAAVNGDPTRTLYVSRQAGDEGWAGISMTDRSNAAINMQGFQVAFAGNDGTTDSMNRGAQIPTSQNNDWAEYNPRDTNGPTGPSFQSFNPSIEATVGSGLDLYRILSSTSGANPTGPVGDGTYLGTLNLNGAGAVDYQVVPEPSSAAIALIGGALLGFARRRRARIVR